tara:strand:+ start:44 stop:484 length:441 start_codon:yes stop_codon:yes gene_type:complete
MAFEPSNLPISISGSTKPNLHSALPESLSDYATDTIGDPRSTARFMIKNVLLTNPGELLSDPNYGVGLRGYLFNQSTNFGDLQSRALSQLRAYVQGVTIISVAVDDSMIDMNTLGMRVTFVNPDKTTESFLIQANTSAGTNTSAYV